MPDLDGPSADMWKSLRLSRPAAFNEYAHLPVLLDGEPTDILAAMTSDNRPRLLVPLAPQAANEDPIHVELKGLTIRETVLKLDGGNQLILDASSEPTEEAMFTVVAHELAKAVALLGRDPRKAVESTIKRWRAFWSSAGKPLTFEEKLGLFGELYLLNRLLIPRLGTTAVSTWKGPLGERHDFQAHCWHIESKVTTKTAPIFRIHGHDQLTPPERKQLLLFCLFASKETGAPDSIEKEVDSIRALLRSDPSALGEFDEALVAIGWFSSEEPFHLRVRGADFYLVGESFPSLGMQELPDGVTRIDWEIDLSQIPATCSDEWEAIVDAVTESTGEGS
jgi:hypothetical protein